MDTIHDIAEKLFGIKQQSLTQSKLIESPKCRMVGALASSVVWIVEGSIHFKVKPKIINLIFTVSLLSMYQWVRARLARESG